MTDKEEIKELLDHFYSIISGEKEVKRDWNKFRDLFSPEAYLSICFKNSKVTTLNVEDYIARLDNLLSENDFFETGEILSYHIVGNIAQVNSIYKAKKNKEDAELIQEGVNFVQFVRLENEWKIKNMLWENKQNN